MEHYQTTLFLESKINGVAIQQRLVAEVSRAYISRYRPFYRGKGARFLNCVPQRRARGWYEKSEWQNGILEAILDNGILH